MAPISGFVQRLGQQLLVNGEPYRIVGANNYYAAYVTEQTQDAVLDLARSFGLNSLRVWAFLDTAQPPGQWDISFQYWDAAQGAPVLNDAPNGLQRLDRLAARARDLGLRLIMTLVNNWKDFGGMPQYVQWFGMSESDKNRFYTDPRCQDAYRNYAGQIVSRYRNEPAILAWELANEPRCEDRGGVDTLLEWVESMAGFIRSLDANHLIAVGDEGYFKHNFAWGQPLYNGGYGVSCEELLGIGDIDFGTMHLYPQSMAKGTDPAEFGLTWIREHLEAAQRANKPMLVEEYGWLGQDAERDPVFATWLESIERQNGAGDMLWMLGLPKSQNQPFDPDGYVAGDPAALPSIRRHAGRMLPAL